MYLIILLLLLVTSIREVLFTQISRRLFNVLYLLLICMVVFRFGQGTDYFNYLSVYEEVDHYTSINGFKGVFLRSDFGFNFLIYLSLYLGISAKHFLAVIGGITMLIAYPFFSRIRNRSIVSLFIFYIGFYLIYVLSGIRQGFALAFLLGVLYPLLLERKYTFYFIFLLLGATIHLSLIVAVCFPFLQNVRMKNSFIFILFISSILITLLNVNLSIFLPLDDRVATYVGGGESSNKFFAVLLRVISILPVFFIPEKVYRENNELRFVQNILIAGFITYAILSFSELLASRVGVYFKVFEIVFVSKLIMSRKIKRTMRHMLGFYYIAIYFVLYFHNINGFIQQGEYHNVSSLTYPYFSVFDDEQKIYKIRKSTYTFL